MQLSQTHDTITKTKTKTKFKKKNKQINTYRYPALPLVHNGSSMEPPLKKTSFPSEFLNYLYTLYIYTNHNHISGKKI